MPKDHNSTGGKTMKTRNSIFYYNIKSYAKEKNKSELVKKNTKKIDIDSFSNTIWRKTNVKFKNGAVFHER